MDDGGVVELYRGRSEMGPRAWRHRSILVDPRRREMKLFVNELVKGIEFFLPFAPIVMEEYANEWFNMSQWGGGGGGGGGEVGGEAGGVAKENGTGRPSALT